MSLKVWLPLNGDLTQQGASEMSITNNGATVNNNGKIGKCYLFDGSDDFISLSGNTLYNIFKGGSQQFSICFWVYHNDATRAIIFGDYGLSGAIGFNIELTTSHGVRFYWNGSPDKNFNSTSYVTAQGWTHVVITYSGSILNIYRNGILSTDSWNGTLATKNKTAGQFYLGRDSRTGTTALNGRLNDFRIYDHCLSATEVHEISQGLVLHYKLDSSYNESSQNLCTAVRPGTGTNITWGGHIAQWTNYDATNDPVPFNEGTKGEIVYGSNGSTGGGASRSICTIAASPSTAYTYSCYIKASDNLAYTHANFLYKYEYTAVSGGTKITEAGYFNNARKELLSNGWYRIWGTFTTRDTTNGINISFYTYPGKNVTYWLGGWQIEQKDHVTPFMSPGTSRNNTIIQDSSGYGHNGTIIGTATTVTSPRYSFGIAMNNTSTANRIDAISLPSEVQTISLWVKGNKATSQVYFADKNSALEFGTYGSLGATNLTSKPLYNLDNFITNEWNHIIVIKDSTNNKLYVNGIAATTSSSNNYYTHNGGLYLFNRNANNNYACNGAISDFRAYVTTLDADAIRQLYELGAKIDNKQNLHTFELIEDQPSIKVTKRGQVKCDDLTESTTTKFYKSKDINTNNLIEL